jgi:hypothetical protein
MFAWLFRRPPSVPTRFRIEHTSYALDGGTTEVIGTDEHGRERIVTLTQHMFPEWRGVGWLYLDRSRIRRRSDTERAIVALLRDGLRELKSRPQEPRDGEPTTLAEAFGVPNAVVWAGPDIAETEGMSAVQVMAYRVEDVLAYIESDDYGKVTG